MGLFRGAVDRVGAPHVGQPPAGVVVHRPRCSTGVGVGGHPPVGVVRVPGFQGRADSGVPFGAQVPGVVVQVGRDGRGRHLSTPVEYWLWRTLCDGVTVRSATACAATRLPAATCTDAALSELLGTDDHRFTQCAPEPEYWLWRTLCDGVTVRSATACAATRLPAATCTDAALSELLGTDDHRFTQCAPEPEY